MPAKACRTDETTGLAACIMSSNDAASPSIDGPRSRPDRAAAPFWKTSRADTECSLVRRIRASVSDAGGDDALNAATKSAADPTVCATVGTVDELDRRRVGRRIPRGGERGAGAKSGSSGADDGGGAGLCRCDPDVAVNADSGSAGP